MKKNITAWVMVGIGVLGVGGYLLRPHPDAEGGPASNRAAGGGGGAGGAVSVSTVRATQRDVAVTLDATGAVSSLNSVEIRPQVSSTISKVHIREGQFVKAGALLFTLDSRTDEVNVTRARAQLAKDAATLADAQRQLARSRELFVQNFIAQGAVDTNQSLVDSQLAVVAADRAAIEAAQVSLGYNRIVAPAAGRAGAINVFAGSYVQPSGLPLVTLTQIDPIAVSFNLPQRNLNEALKSLRNGGGSVAAVLPEGRGTLQGKLQFVDNAVDASSGNVKVKAVFDNKEEALWPGAYVSVRLTVQTLKDAISVPQAAIVQGPRGKTVYVVGDDNKAAQRPIELIEAVGADAVVTGVRPGERVVVDGRQNVRPGGAVAEFAGKASDAKAHGNAATAASATTVVTP